MKTNNEEGLNAPNRRLLQLLEDLLYHHKTVRKQDAYGVQLYTSALEAYLEAHKLPSGVSNYLLNRIHTKGRWSTYYSKVHIKGHKVKQENPLVLYFRQRPEEIVLSTEGFAKGVKDEVKLHLAGSVEAYDAWIDSIVRQEQVRLVGLLMARITSGTRLMELPVLIKTCLLKSIGCYLMGIGPSLAVDELILLKSLLKANGVYDVYGVFG
jgi:hypothetical protein